MLTLKCIGSGSNGNCYLLYSGDDVLIIDCGLSIGDIKRGLNYKITGIKGVLSTHGHFDHSYSLKDFRKMHIPVFAPYEQAEKKISKVEYGPFKVMALPLLDNGGNTQTETVQSALVTHFLLKQTDSAFYM